MAKIGKIQNDKKRRQMVAQYASKRAELKRQAKDPNLSPEERFQARMRLNELPRNSSKTRPVNRCQVTGRPHGYYRKFQVSRIALRELAADGQLPGVVKSSW
jgi:small subunit ribosomal protein S14